MGYIAVMEWVLLQWSMPIYGALMPTEVTFFGSMSKTINILEAISMSMLLSVSVFKISWIKEIFTCMLGIGSKKTSTSYYFFLHSVF